MRLLHTSTLQLTEFLSDIPPYSILSHTWDKNEVLFSDLQNLELAKNKAGYAKVEKACAHARRYKFDWIWIDSCCINKESSAELSEALNSMYQYYQDAEVCYAYLSDTSSDEDPRDPSGSFKLCRWFTRGWTLQELLAPSYVVFFDKDWREIGTKWSLRDVISAITSIPISVLVGGDIEGLSVAKRMSWAAFRQTTRPEDQAYCLMGIFGVSMPPIYGEGGAKAFMRLQQEIIKFSDDRSIFAWIASPRIPGAPWLADDGPRGLFARSPFEFRWSGEVGASDSDSIGSVSSFSFSNNGLHIHLPLEPDPDNLQRDPENTNGLFFAYLHCRSEKTGEHLSVHLRKTDGLQFIRCHADEVRLSASVPTVESMSEIIIKEHRARIRCKKTTRGPSSLALLQVMPAPSAEDICIVGSDPWEPFKQEDFVLQHRTRGILTIRFSDVVPFLGDRFLKPLGNGDWVALAIQLTGDRRAHHSFSIPILELDFISSSTFSARVMRKALKPPELSFTAPKFGLFYKSRFFIKYKASYHLCAIFPPDFHQRDDGRRIHLTLNWDVPRRVFIYRVVHHSFQVYQSSHWQCLKSDLVAVVFELRGSRVWARLLFVSGDSVKEAERVWSFYRYDEHSGDADGSIFKMEDTELDLTFEAFMTIKLENRNNLQPGSHLLRFRLENWSVSSE